MDEYKIKQMIRDTINTQSFPITSSGQTILTAISGAYNIIEMSAISSSNDVIEFFTMDLSGTQSTYQSVWKTLAPGLLTNTTLENEAKKRSIDIQVPVLKLSPGRTLRVTSLLAQADVVTITSWNDTSL